jgi:hypothetical protein
MQITRQPNDFTSAELATCACVYAKASSKVSSHTPQGSIFARKRMCPASSSAGQLPSGQGLRRSYTACTVGSSAAYPSTPCERECHRDCSSCLWHAMKKDGLTDPWRNCHDLRRCQGQQSIGHVLDMITLLPGCSPPWSYTGVVACPACPMPAQRPGRHLAAHIMLRRSDPGKPDQKYNQPNVPQHRPDSKAQPARRGGTRSE